jgi:PleD family two-component response regulator
VAAADAALYEAKRLGKNRVARSPAPSSIRDLR